MSLKITYVPEKTETKKKANWRNLPKGTIFVLGEYYTCLKTVKEFIVLASKGELEFYHPRFSNAHGWDNQSLEILGKLTGIEITEE